MGLSPEGYWEISGNGFRIYEGNENVVQLLAYEDPARYGATRLFLPRHDCLFTKCPGIENASWVGLANLR